MIVYNLETGKILVEIPNNADPYRVLRNRKDIKENNIGTLVIEKPIGKIAKYMVKNNELIPLSESEENEMRKYRRLLSEYERMEIKLLEDLQPSYEEIQKAENTIEILELLSEVL